MSPKEFKISLRKAPGHRSYYPAVIHIPCNLTVVTGHKKMDYVVEAMETHECVYKDTNATSS